MGSIFVLTLESNCTRLSPRYARMPVPRVNDSGVLMLTGSSV